MFRIEFVELSNKSKIIKEVLLEDCANYMDACDLASCMSDRLSEELCNYYIDYYVYNA